MRYMVTLWGYLYPVKHDMKVTAGLFHLLLIQPTSCHQHLGTPLGEVPPRPTLQYIEQGVVAGACIRQPSNHLSLACWPSSGGQICRHTTDVE